MVIVMFRGGRGAALTLAHAEQEEFVNQLIVASHRLAKTEVVDGDPGPGGQIALGSDAVEIGPEDVALQVSFDPDPVVDYSLGARPTPDQLYVASVALDEMARFHLRQAMLEAARQQQPAPQQEMKRGLHVVQQHTKERGPIQ